MELRWLREIPATDEEAIKYIPQISAAQNLYYIYREIGEDIIEAMIKVLQACVGEKETNIERK